MLTRDEARKLTDQVLGMSKAEGMSLSLHGGQASHLRFARNSPSTSGTNTNLTLSITSRFGKRSGSSSVNQFDGDSLAAAVRRSEEIARLAPEDPELLPELGAQKHAQVDAWVAATAERGASGMANGVKQCLERAIGAGVIAAGFTDTDASISCIATSKGLFGFHRSTTASISATMRTKDATGSGWATDAARNIEDVDYDRVSRVATDKALASAKPRPLDPGKYVTVLEPSCVAGIIEELVYSLGARRADEGRSYFAAKGGGNRLGEKLFPASITIHSDPTDPLAPSSPWGEDGLPQIKRTWIDRGAVANLSYDRFWAQKQGKQPVPAPSNTIMNGGSGTLDDLIAGTKRGVLVTSFWYIRTLDPRTMLNTGLTRDGVFWIENGKISHPVNNFRWNESAIAVLKNVDAMSKAVRVPERGGRTPTTIVPALRVKSFNFASVSDAV
jgi:predicted Zn-dependent protease